MQHDQHLTQKHKLEGPTWKKSVELHKLAETHCCGGSSFAAPDGN
ncbi:hypothetical protein SynRS9907_01182 [Synechococcus sp. RS9907]|nr:hypothetical protein SynRS9907_01182 [Synechococcus sp. RS9907]